MESPPPGQTSTVRLFLSFLRPSPATAASVPEDRGLRSKQKSHRGLLQRPTVGGIPTCCAVHTLGKVMNDCVTLSDRGHHCQAVADGLVAGYRYDSAHSRRRRDCHMIGIGHIYCRQVSMVIDFEKPLVLPRVNDF